MKHRGTEVGEALGALHGELGPLLAGASVRSVDDDRLLDLISDAEALGRIADALRLELAGELADRCRPALGDDRLSRQRGCRSAAELLERASLVSGATARHRFKTADALRQRMGITGAVQPAKFDAVRRALLDGELGLDTATAIVDALTPVRDRGVDPTALESAERALVADAVGADGSPEATADEVSIMAKVWALHLDPDGALPNEDTALRRRGLSLGRERGGTVPIRGELLAEVAAQLERLNNAYLNPRVDAGPTFLPEDFETTDGDRLIDPRTQPQRRHDAFAGILQVAAGAQGAPLLGGAAPTLVVAVSEEQLVRKTSGVAFVSGGIGVGAVSTAVAAQVGCTGNVQRVVIAPDGRIVELGSPQRNFGANQRRVIAVRDEGCIIPGCDVPAMWCEVHHVIPAAQGGPTHTDNGVLLCWFHPRTIDTGGWEIRMIRGVPWVRAPQWIDPDRRWRSAAGSPLRRLIKAGAPPSGAADEG